MLKARILLKADASAAGEIWSDGQIAAALDTSIDTIARTCRQLVEEGLDAALTRKHSPNAARMRIFDGAAEAKLIALACPPPPKGRKRWTLKKPSQALPPEAMGHPAGGQRCLRSRHGGRPGGLSEVT